MGENVTYHYKSFVCILRGNLQKYLCTSCLWAVREEDLYKGYNSYSKQLVLCWVKQTIPILFGQTNNSDIVWSNKQFRYCLVKQTIPILFGQTNNSDSAGSNKKFGLVLGQTNNSDIVRSNKQFRYCLVKQKILIVLGQTIRIVISQTNNSDSDRSNLWWWVYVKRCTVWHEKQSSLGIKRLSCFFGKLF